MSEAVSVPVSSVPVSKPHAGARHAGHVANAELPLMLVTPALFAANLLVARWAESAGLPPLFLAFGRWALAFAILLPAVGPRLWALRHVIMEHFPRLILLAGLGMGMAVGPQYIGARHTSAANIAIIFAACPALVMLLETLVWKAPPACLRLRGAFQTRVSSSMTSAGQAAKMMAMLAALVWRAPMYCGPTAMPMPRPASRIRRGKCAMIRTRCAHRRGPTSGSRSAKASAQRPKARNSGGRAALSAQRATSRLAANRAGVTNMSGSSALAESIR